MKHFRTTHSEQNDADRALSARARSSPSLSNYLHWKYQADKDLVHRTTFPWTILRPTELANGPGTGRADIGRTHITTTISVREDASPDSCQ